MKIIEEKLSNGNTLTYRVEDSGTAYEIKRVLRDGTVKEFPQVTDSLIQVLEQCRQYKNRIRLWYGDIKTGRSWNEEYNIIGTIGRSSGSIKIPLLINNRRSHGGMAILTSCLIRIDDIISHRTLWKVDNFHVEKMRIELPSPELREDGYVASVMMEKDSGAVENVSNFKNEDSAKRWVQFMNGERYSK